MRHQIGDRLAVPGQHDPLARLRRPQQFGELGLGLLYRHLPRRRWGKPRRLGIEVLEGTLDVPQTVAILFHVAKVTTGGHFCQGTKKGAMVTEEAKTGKLLDLIVNQSKVINRLQAFNTIQTFALIELLKRSSKFTDTDPGITAAYEEARTHALALIDLADNRDAFEQFLKLADNRFMGIYE